MRAALLLFACILGLVLAEESGYSQTHFYTYDGRLNNEKYPEWGSLGEPFIHDHPWMGWSFDDKYFVNKPVSTTPEHPSPRYVSNKLSKVLEYQEAPINKKHQTALLVSWGQFLAHEMALAPAGEEPLPILIPKCDETFDRECRGGRWMTFNRSEAIPGTGRPGWPRLIPNQITAWLDGGNVYGNKEIAYLLRAGTGGKLRTTPYPPFHDGAYPPRVGDYPYDIQEKITLGYNHVQNPVGIVSNKELFVCGDGRCNQNPVLLSLHILFLREHNRVAHRIQKAYPTWSDERVFQAARKYVVAEIQRVTFEEYFPALIGRPFPTPYYGYDAKVNPDIHDFFMAVAFRFGHSQVYERVKRLDMDRYESIDDGDLWLFQTFFNPRYLNRGVSTILRGSAYAPAGEVDGLVVNDMRNYLFGGGRPRYDAAAFNMMRAWDHGIPFYNEVRYAYNLTAPQYFKDFPSSLESVKKALASVYLAPYLIDPWIGGLLEDHVKGSSLGPLFERAVIDQFRRVRDGDRFWYENRLKDLDALASASYLEPIRHRTLAKIIRENSAVYLCPDNVFLNYNYGKKY